MTQASPYTMEWYQRLERNASALFAGLEELWCALVHPYPTAAVQRVDLARITIDLVLWSAHLCLPQQPPELCERIGLWSPSSLPIAPGLRWEIVVPRVQALAQAMSGGNATLMADETLGRIEAVAIMARLSVELARAAMLEQGKVDLVRERRSA